MTNKSRAAGLLEQVRHSGGLAHHEPEYKEGPGLDHGWWVDNPNFGWTKEEQKHLRELENKLADIAAQLRKPGHSPEEKEKLQKSKNPILVELDKLKVKRKQAEKKYQDDFRDKNKKGA